MFSLVYLLLGFGIVISLVNQINLVKRLEVLEEFKREIEEAVEACRDISPEE